MPLHMRLPKLPGFKNFNEIQYTVVNLQRLDQFDSGAIVDTAALRSKGLVRKKGPVKILGNGEISKPITVRVQACSAAAAQKIEAAGGTVELVAKPGEKRAKTGKVS